MIPQLPEALLLRGLTGGGTKTGGALRLGKSAANAPFVTAPAAVAEKSICLISSTSSQFFIYFLIHSSRHKSIKKHFRSHALRADQRRLFISLPSYALASDLPEELI